MSLHGRPSGEPPGAQREGEPVQTPPLHRATGGVLGSPQTQSIAWQVLGSVATLGAALWVSWRLGLSAQGDFGLAKSWFDAAAVIAALGLPQGLLHLQYRLAVPAGALRGMLACGLALLAAVAALAAAGMLAAGQVLAAAVLASLPFAVGHLLARSILLAQRGVRAFGIVTALPALLVLAGVLAWGLTGRSHGFEQLLLAAALLSGATSLVLAWRSAPASVLPVAWPQRELWRVSLQSWLQAALGGLLGAGLLSLVAWQGGGGPELGAASLGLHLYQLFAVAAGYLAPLLYDRLARQTVPTLRGWPAPARQLAVALMALSLLGIGLSVLKPPWSAWLLPLALMLPAGVAAVAARVAGTVLLARGAYSELSLQAAARLLLALASAALALRWLPAAAALAAALLVTELATWWRVSALLRAGAR